jgi:CHAD domain-containing protein
MTHDLENVRRLTIKLRENLVKCGDDPDVDAVHDTRTGTRRLQATLEALAREVPEGEPVRETAMAAMRLLKRIRHEAGPVRDLDVHRKLVEKLTKRAGAPGAAGDGAESTAANGPAEGNETSRARAAVDRQAGDLDAWLKHRRAELAHGLQEHAQDLAGKLDKRMEELEAALGERSARRARKKPAGVVALDNFARLATEMQVLDAGNLHDFRKGAKKARYVAELAAQGDAQARQVGEALRKLQDEIGDWHDWLVLAEEAQAALGDEAVELTGLIAAERERHFVAAMKTAAKLRGRLMGEWLAVSRRSVQRSAIGVQERRSRRLS